MFNLFLVSAMRNIAGYTALLGVLDELGGWPMLDGDDWNASNYHWEDSFIKLSKLNQNYIIGIEPMIDFRNTSKTIIKVRSFFIQNQHKFIWLIAWTTIQIPRKHSQLSKLCK